MKKIKWTKFIFIAMLLCLSAFLGACTEKEESNNSNETNQGQEEKKRYEVTNKEEKETLKNNITLSSLRGFIGDEVEFTATDLTPNTEVSLIWEAYEGEWEIENLFTVVGPKFTTKEIELVKGKSDNNGEWKGSFTVPKGFGGDMTIYVAENGKKVSQTAYTIDPKFTMEPESGPVGSEILIKVEGLGWSTYMRNWQLTYDNKYTGLISAISSDGTAVAKIRAAGLPGKHVIRIRTGYLGMPYINYLQSPYPDKPAPEFVFTVTDEPAIAENYVEEAPTVEEVVMPELKNKDGVQVTLDKTEGIVGEPVKLTASGLPKGKEVEFIFNTMRGSRVSGNGFGEETVSLGKEKTDENGNLEFAFEIPDDLGGIPHRIDLVADGEIQGQTYLRILPSIVTFEPKSGPVGTIIKVTIKGGGWTEFDNAYYLTYDNAYAGYLCAFNSKGDLTFDVVATGEPGYHIIDLYPGVYRQKDKSETDMTLIPQLTYSSDHPGSAMPVIRMGFTITE